MKTCVEEIMAANFEMGCECAYTEKLGNKFLQFDAFQAFGNQTRVFVFPDKQTIGYCLVHSRVKYTSHHFTSNISRENKIFNQKCRIIECVGENRPENQ